MPQKAWVAKEHPSATFVFKSELIEVSLALGVYLEFFLMVAYLFSSPFGGYDA